MIAMNDATVPEESELGSAGAVMDSLGRGLPVVDVLLTLARVHHSLSSGWLHKYNVQYSQRTLWRALARLEGAGYVIRRGREYSVAPFIFVPPNKFLPPMKSGIAEVDLLLLVLSGVKRPKHSFSILWGGERSAEYVYHKALRRLVQFGYLERDRGWWYHLGKRTTSLLSPAGVRRELGYIRNQPNISKEYFGHGYV